MSRVKIPQDTGDYRLLSRRAVNSLRQLREQHRFMKGLFTWIGYPQKEVLYDRDPRFAGKTKWNYWRLWNFALEGITSFTITPPEDSYISRTDSSTQRVCVCIGRDVQNADVWQSCRRVSFSYGGDTLLGWYAIDHYRHSR